MSEDQEKPAEPEGESEKEKERKRRTRFHRLMGMLIRESFKGFPIEIDTEIDVSEVEQRIDIVVKLTVTVHEVGKSERAFCCVGVA